MNEISKYKRQDRLLILPFFIYAIYNYVPGIRNAIEHLLRRTLQRSVLLMSCGKIYVHISKSYTFFAIEKL